MLERIRVVLVNTSHPGNIGGAARAMKNMGLKSLFLVEPRKYPHNDANARAAGADDILNGAQVVASLEEALQGCSVVLGTSARDRRIPWPLLDPREAAETCLNAWRADHQADIALVFGREYAGLTNTELQRCQYHIHIPADPEFSSLNLATAVQVLAYEVRMAWLKETEQPTHMPEVEATGMLGSAPATHESLELFYEHLQQTLIEIDFLDPAKPRHLMARLRRIYGRSQLKKSEVNILRGILTETQKAARGEVIQRRGEHV
ncbi:MAG TPA: tRNA (cytosine(32)/uridine(32)-2'-O)-methyltransferase TrmJ [Thiopseudomonas sp.]|nr:tRNA (cytosine(32)/uridine(32)-2'-O)-methyltransferase TrmJ [Thiopseudomonas sp.]